MAQNNQNEAIQPVLLNNEAELVSKLIKDESQIKRVHFQDDGKSNKIQG